MCGICGLLKSGKNCDSYQDIVKRMNSALIHRGPDGEGMYSDDFISLAMRRLSIIDLQGGWQPIYNEDGSLVLIANGEIYNFIELRKDLEIKGHAFSTKSDCETILHLYEEYGTACVHHLRGMFAFALWDTRKGRLTLARDRMGEKPLYLYERDGCLLFASEMKALLSSGEVPFDLDPRAINRYFYYQYVPEPQTPIKNVRKLPAGHIVTVDISPWRCSETSYWQMENAPPLTGNPGELIRNDLEEISGIIIRSDVPVGIALSGGLDSSAVAALTVKKYPDIMHAFSIGYPDRPPCDERMDAQQFADYLGMPFHDIVLKTEDMVSDFPSLVYHRDDPIADISGYGYYSVMKLAHDHNVPVMLQGQGGDELFFGYTWIRDAVKESIRKQDFLSRKNITWTDYFEWRFPGFTSPYEVLRWVRTMGGIVSARNRYQRDKTSPEDQLVFIDTIPDFHSMKEYGENFFTPSFTSQVSENDPYALFTTPLPWKNIDIMMTKLITQTYLLENGIAQGDRLSMASSVELRLPLVDYKLVETVIGLRKNYPDYTLQPKAWFKAALKGIVPEWVMKRPKRGFAPPVREWHDAVFQSYGNMLDEGYLVESKVLKPETAKQLSKGPYPSNTITPLSFKALVLELWCRKMSQTA
jgi:asparagine synthase (glutamine-hydrolysing)